MLPFRLSSRAPPLPPLPRPLLCHHHHHHRHHLLFLRHRSPPQRYATTSSTTPFRLAPAALALAASVVALGAFSTGAWGIKQVLPGTGPVDTTPLPAPGSSSVADRAAVAESTALIQASPQFRALAADADSWIEQPDVYAHLSPAARATRLVSGTLWGHRRISCNRVFFSTDGRRCISFLALGTALCGHPNTVHGGLLATLLDEALGRLAIRQFPAGGAVTARLEVDYRSPVRAMDGLWNPHGFVVLDARTVECSERKVSVAGEIRDRHGRLLAEGRALFVVPRGWKPPPLGGN